MLAGITGPLLPGAYLESIVAADDEVAAPDRQLLARLARWWRRVERTLGPASSARAMADVGALALMEVFGLAVERLEPHGNGFLGAVCASGHTRTVLATTIWGADAGAAWRGTVRAGRVAGARWGLVYTGNAITIVDATRTWSRRSLTIDLPRACTDDRSARALAVLIAAAHASPDTAGALHHLVARGDEHGRAVCASLGDGVLDALGTLLGALEIGQRHRRHGASPPVFEQSLTIVYRLLFLLFAESRSVVPTWHQVYRDAYTIQALCRFPADARERRGAWKALQAISRLAHDGCRAGDLVVTPFNGRLFSPRHAPLVERARIDDHVVAQAVSALATRPARHGRERIAYADLGVEQLGAVYERVLEYQPARTAGQVTLVRTSQERKTSGSFYTPRSMTEFLVRRALHPLVAERRADEILALKVVDPAMGSGAFLVAACRYLGAAVEHALIAEGRLTPEAGIAERSAIRQMVAQRCLYGVDRNAMAVQLARLSLWLTTLSTGRPLTFLDHHLAVGDSLMGAWAESLVRWPGAMRRRRGAGDPTLPLFAPEMSEAMSRDVLPGRFRLALAPEETAADVREKERALARLTAAGAPLARWKSAADLWCAAWLWPGGPLAPGVYADVLAGLVGGRQTLVAHHGDTILATAAAAAARHRFFHWHLEFPEVFFGADGQPDPAGGFDAVIGNPPWDVLRADTGNREERASRRRDQQDVLAFFRDAGIYRYQGRGHANSYQLFFERAMQLARPGGRVALVLPSGFATDHGSAALRRQVLDTVRVDRLIGFDNRTGIFPIHRDVRFLLLTGTKGTPTERLACVFGRTTARWLDELPDAASDDEPGLRAVAPARVQLEAWDPDHMAIPWLTSAADAAIFTSVFARVPRLGDARGWGARFGRELNATDDRPHFVSRDTPGRLIAVIEGKHLAPFHVDIAASALAIPDDRARLLVRASETFGRTRLAYRDVASATNRLTLIAALLPPGTISTHTLFCLKTPLGVAAQYCLLALLNSLVANYLVRLQMTTHVTATLMARLPVPRPAEDADDFRDLVALARSLEGTGVAAGEAACARLNAIAASLYGLTLSQYEHVVSSFPLLSAGFRAACVSLFRAQEGGVHGRATETQRHGGHL